MTGRDSVKLIFSILATLFLVACGGNGNDSVTGAAPTAPSIPSAPTATPDTTPPSPVSSFNLLPVPSGNGIELTWVNPVDVDFEGVALVRSDVSNPTSPIDGTSVYEGANTSFTDIGLVNGTQYFYTIFAYDEIPNYSNGKSGSVTPIRPIAVWDSAVWNHANSLYEIERSSGNWDNALFQ